MNYLLFLRRKFVLKSVLIKAILEVLVVHRLDSTKILVSIEGVLRDLDEATAMLEQWSETRWKSLRISFRIKPSSIVH